MSETDKLSRDLTILLEMVAEFPDYLKSEVLFWQMMKGGMPKLTLGGILLRMHRLWALRELLAEDEAMRLETAVTQFNLALSEKIVRFEQKAHQEMAARLRQWSEVLKDLDWDKQQAIAGYAAAVDTRAIIQALVDKLETPPYRLDKDLARQASLLDSSLRRRWQTGSFVWPDSWQPAYPQREYWWLYGRPK